LNDPLAASRKSRNGAKFYMLSISRLALLESVPLAAPSLFPEFVNADIPVVGAKAVVSAIFTRKRRRLSL
jgi:hypothetical protein